MLMYLVSVAPIKRGIPIDELSYFTKEHVPPGALVSVPLRGRMVPFCEVQARYVRKLTIATVQMNRHTNFVFSAIKKRL